MGQGYSINIEINQVANRPDLVGVSTFCKYKKLPNNSMCLDWKTCREFIDFMDMLDS